MSGYKKTANARPVINITIPEELLDKIEDYRYNEIFSNRSQAICNLIESGLKISRREKEVDKYCIFVC